MKNEELLAALVGIMAEKSCCGACSPCIDAETGLQYSHSLARFNEQSAQTVAASQQNFVSQQSAQIAQLLALTSDLTNGRPTKD